MKRRTRTKHSFRTLALAGLFTHFLGGAGVAAAAAQGEAYAGTAGDAVPGEYEASVTTAADGAAASQRVAYETLLVVRDGQAVSSTESGHLDLELWRRVARPWDYVDQGLIYDEEAWATGDDLGGQEHGYRVVESSVQPVEAVKSLLSTGETEISASLAEALEQARPDQLLRLLVKVRVPRPPPLPYVPHAGAVGTADYKAASEQRAVAYERQRLDFLAMPEVEGILSVVRLYGGRMGAEFPRTRWLALEAPAAAIAKLELLDSVERIHLEETAVDHGLPMRNLRNSNHTDATRFREAGYHGDNGSGSPLIVGVVEVDGIEDEVCYLDDNGAGSADSCDTGERLRKKYNCTWSAGCSETSNYGTGQEGRHGTVVTSIIAADYTQNQAASFNVGSSLGFVWQEKATGWAKEADVHYYRFTGGSTNQAKAIQCAQGSLSGCSEVDVLNSSNGYTSGSCDPTSSTTLEDEIEDLWDTGVLPVISAGNGGGSVSSTACTVAAPADTPKAFAVAGLKTSTADYHTWGRMASGSIVSARGGADIEVGGVLRSGTMSVIDLAAAGEDIEFVTTDDGTYGTVSPSYTCDGTSFAAPQVAGAALAVKDWYLQTGNLWISSPGRLHAVMLAMGDRGTLGTGSATSSNCVYGDQLRCGADELLGLGRLKLRLLENGQGMGPWGWWYKTVTLTASTVDPFRQVPWTLGLPSGAKMVKCVMQQREDMSSKDDISLIGLRVRIRSKVNGTCVANQGTVYKTRYDALFDDKHMVTVLDSEVNIENRCVVVEFDRVYLSSANRVTNHTYCYYAGKLDNEF